MVRNKITETQYKNFQKAYDYFNDKLFSGELPECLITFVSKKNCGGYYRPKCFGEKGNAEGSIAELAMNPILFSKDEKYILSILVHEMCHCWQQEFGKPSRNGYHNREWAEKMDDVGLIASSTGEDGGKQTGQRMSHYIDEAGEFDMLSDQYLFLQP